MLRLGGEVIRVERRVIGEDEVRVVVAGHRAGRPRLLADGALLGHLSGWIDGGPGGQLAWIDERMGG